MSTQATVFQELPLGTERTTTTPVPAVRLFWWSIRREFWENHSLVIAPAVVAALVLLGFFFGPFGLRNLTYAGSPASAQDHLAARLPYLLVAGLVMVTTLLVSVFYAADALYAERRDRSVLFWKSLPVSDLTTVFAKAAVPLLALPLISFVVTLAAHVVMAAAGMIALVRLGNPVAPYLAQVALPHLWLSLFVHFFTVSALWYAPFYAWLLLVSAASTRAPLLLAFLPPLALAALEAIVFHTTYVGTALRTRLAHGNVVGSFGTATDRLNTPEMWLGLLAAGVLLAATVAVRRYRSTI